MAILLRTVSGLLLALALSAAQSSGPDDKLRRAAELMRAGKPEDAAALYRELAAAYPSEPSYTVNFVVASYKAGRFRETVDECSALLKRRPDLFPPWLFLGAGRLALGEAAEAVEPLRKAAAMRPQDRNARVMLAQALLAANRNAEAAAAFEEAARLAPDNPAVTYGMARAYEAAARDSMRRLQPGSTELLALEGDREFRSGQYARAYRKYRNALAVNPRFPGLHEAIARVYEATGHPDWARTERAREPAAAVEPAPLYREAKALDAKAGQAYARLEALPPSTERYEAAGNAHDQAGRYPEAAAAWKEALRLSPGQPESERRLALALCRSNDCASALPLIKTLLAREPASAELNSLCGAALIAGQRPAEALPYLEAAVKLDPKSLAARAALGEAYLQAGDAERAIPQLEAAVAEDEDGSRHYQLARAYQAAGNRDRAAAVLRDYRAILGRLEQAAKDEPRITPPEP